MTKYFSILFFLGISFRVLSQLPADYSLKHLIKQDGLTMEFTVLDSDKKSVSNHNRKKVYYWYKAQKVITTQGGNSGQLLHGKFESLYSNKQLCQKGSFKKGLKTSEWKYWQADGSLLHVENWKKGKLRGKQYDYNSNGEIYKITVVKWRKARSNTLDSIVEISGHSRKITTIDSLGRKIAVARFRKGLLHGKQESFTDGKEVTVYKNGELVVKKEKESSAGEKPESEKRTLSEKTKELFRKKEKSPYTENGKVKEKKNPKEPKNKRSATTGTDEKKESQEKRKFFRKKE